MLTISQTQWISLRRKNWNQGLSCYSFVEKTNGHIPKCFIQELVLYERTSFVNSHIQRRQTERT